MAKAGPRKKLPKELAVINADNCTGCESCLEVCPVDCINLLKMKRRVKGQPVLVRDRPGALRRLRGLRPHPAEEEQPLRADRLPLGRHRNGPDRTGRQVVAQIGGPPEYIHENWDRLVGTAQHLAELKATTG